MSRDLPTALEKLANYRAQNTRASQDVFEQGLVALDADAVMKQGDDGEHHQSTSNIWTQAQRRHPACLTFFLYSMGSLRATRVSIN